MNTKESITQNNYYESPAIKLIEFDVEIGFAASEMSEIPNAGFTGAIQASDGRTHSY